MRLTDCFSELIAYVSYFLKTVSHKQPPFEEISKEIHRLLSETNKCIEGGNFSEEDYDLARFAICAWIDEVILSSPWKDKTEWQRQQLQRIYYNTTDAGELFFDKLNNLGLHQRDVREVYYLCLSMGFMGRYCQKGDEYLLEQLKTSNLKLLMGSSVDIPSLEKVELFPEAYPKESREKVSSRQGWRHSPIFFILGVGPLLFFGVLFLVYSFILNSVASSFLNTVP